MSFFSSKTPEVVETVNTPEDEVEKLLQYNVGEVCKCYFTEIKKNVNETISQQINKCQAYCRVVAKNLEETKSYTVRLFDTDGTVKKLPGRCLRKVKCTPYNYDEASTHLSEVIESNDDCVAGRITMVISCVEDGENAEDVIKINSIPADVLMKEYHFKSNGAPVCNIVMLKADEVFDNGETEY